MPVWLLFAAAQNKAVIKVTIPGIVDFEAISANGPSSAGKGIFEGKNNSQAGNTRSEEEERREKELITIVKNAGTEDHRLLQIKESNKRLDDVVIEFTKKPAKEGDLVSKLLTIHLTNAVISSFEVNQEKRQVTVKINAQKIQWIRDPANKNQQDDWIKTN